MNEEYSDDGESRLTTISTDELHAELEETKALRWIRAKEGNASLVKFHTGVIDRIRAELKRRAAS